MTCKSDHIHSQYNAPTRIYYLGEAISTISSSTAKAPLIQRHIGMAVDEEEEEENNFELIEVTSDEIKAAPSEGSDFKEQYDLEGASILSWRKAYLCKGSTKLDSTTVVNAETVSTLPQDKKSPSAKQQVLSQKEADTTTQQRNSRQDLLLHASLQLSENATYYHQKIRTIYHAVRNFKQKGTCNVAELLPRLHELVKQDRMPFYLSSGISILKSGWISYISSSNSLKNSSLNNNSTSHAATYSSTSSIGIMGSQWLVDKLLPKKLYWAVLWEDQLSLFKNMEYSRKYFLALSRERKGSWSQVGRRMIKEYAPLIQLDIEGWSGKYSEKEFGKQSMGLFDQQGEMQHVLEFETTVEAFKWIKHIQVASHREILVQQEFLARAQSQLEYIASLQEHPLVVPLQWLHLKLDKIDKNATLRRLKSASIEQALKDIHRDQIAVNGTIVSVKDILSEIAVRIMQHSEKNFREMDAIQFARRILICSARTQGGGDVLDAVHLFLRNPHVYICSDAELVDPVEITILKENGRPEAHITIRMYFRIIQMNQNADQRVSLWGHGTVMYIEILFTLSLIRVMSYMSL